MLAVLAIAVKMGLSTTHTERAEMLASATVLLLDFS